MKTIALCRAVALAVGLLCVSDLRAEKTDADAKAALDKALPTQIKDVLVYANQARVTRSVDVKLEKGLNTITLKGFPGSMEDANISADVSSSTAWVKSVSVKYNYLFEEGRTEDDPAFKRLTQLTSERDAMLQERSRLCIETWYLQMLTPTIPSSENEKGLPIEVSTESWAPLLTLVSSQMNDKFDALLKLEQALRDKEFELSQQQLLWKTLSAGKNTVEKTLEVLVDAKEAQNAALQVTYATPHARWFPLYDVRVSPADGSVALSYFAVVSQNSGENWDNVPISFSSANPATAADLPEFTKILIAENFNTPTQREEVYVAHGGVRRSAGMGLGTAKKMDVQQKLAMQNARPQSVALEADQLTKPAYARPPVPAVQANMLCEEACDECEAELGLGDPSEVLQLMGWGEGNRSQTSSTDRFLSGFVSGGDYTFITQKGETIHPREVRAVRDAMVTYVDASGAEQTVPVASIKGAARRTVQTRALEIPVDRLVNPARGSEGFDYRFKSVRNESIGSDNHYRRIALKTEQLKGERFYKLVPSASPHAYLCCKVANLAATPILPGPVSVFYGTEYVGESMLSLSQGAHQILNLGVDPRVKLERVTTKNSKTIGLVAKARETSIETVITITNNTPEKIGFDLLDCIPVSQSDRIMFKDYNYSIAPTKEERIKGLLQWEKAIDAGGKFEVKISYAVEYPTDFVILYSTGGSAQPGFGPTIDQAKQVK